ncbi:hypothetical protein BU183_04695 [Enterococcus faecium]|nr:hypothetical protein BU183_04695 [Enterococcus faecium]
MDKKIIGIDLGGTTAKFAILTPEGEIQQKWSIDTNILNLRVHTKWIHLLFVSYEDNQNLQLPYLFRFENYRSNLT